MIDKNNIRFSFEQKNQNFVNQQQLPNEKQGIGRLLSKYERSRPFDDQQEQQIVKKKTVYQGNSLNYSQIYSDIRINRNDKIFPRNQHQQGYIKKNNESTNLINNNKQDLSAFNSALYAPKSLPKIMKNSRMANQSQSSKWDQNATYNEINDKNSQQIRGDRGRTFSINHYDIYKPGFLINRNEINTNKNYEEIHESKMSQKNNSFAHGELHKELEEQIPQQPLIIHFQNQSDLDLPQAKGNQSQLSNNKSQLLKKRELKLQGRNYPQQSANKPNELSQKTEQRIQSKGNQSQAVTRLGQPLKKKDLRKSQIQKTTQRQNVVIQKEKPQIKKGQGFSRLSKRNKIDIIEDIELDKSLIKFQQEKTKKQTIFQRQKQKSNGQSIANKNYMKRSHYEKQQIEQSINVPKYENRGEDILSIPSVKAKFNDSKLFKPLNINQKQQKQLRSNNVFQNNTKIDQLNQIKNQHQRHYQNSREKNQSNTLSQPNKHIQKEETVVKRIIQHTPNQQKKQQTYRPYQYFKFNVDDYMKIYQILKNIQNSLRVPVIDTHALIKQIKHYLQTVAGGSLDHIDGYDMPLHRLKIVKNALLYERIAVVIISFSYVVNKIKQSLKYLINLITYATNNTLLILKILQSCQISKQTAKNPIIAKSDRLVLKRNYDSVRNNNDIILDSIFKISKYQQAFSQSFKDILKSVGKTSLEQTFYNVLQYFAFFLCVSQLHMSIPFLAVAPNPYLRETIDLRPTLVIDVVQIFCHGTRKSKSHVFRPHAEHFLHQMAQYFEIVSFTCAYPNQIDKVIDILDPKKYIKHRLYRHHAILKHNVLYKQTERIGRDLNKLILIDSQMNTIAGQSNNTIMIPIWKGNKNDTTLAELCPILAAIAIKHLDCKQATRKIHEQQIQNQNAGIKYLNFGINLQ